MIDLGEINFEPDVPTWPTIGCQNTAGSATDTGGGDSYVCLYYQSPISTEYTGVGYIYLTKGDQGPFHAIQYCMCGGNGVDGGVDLGVAPGGTVSKALAWAGGTVVGFGDAADGATHALYWAGKPGAIVLPMPPGVDPHAHSEAHAINSAGEIVGFYSLASDPQNVGSRAVLWEPDPGAPDGTGYLAYDLTALLPAANSGLVLSAAYAITCAGDVAADGVPAARQDSEQDAALYPHRYVVTRETGNGASCPQ